jgi:hypothetical protein
VDFETVRDALAARFRELVDRAAEHDFAASDALLPHPVYGGRNWVCVLNPGRTWPMARQLLARKSGCAHLNCNDEVGGVTTTTRPVNQRLAVGDQGANVVRGDHHATPAP